MMRKRSGFTLMELLIVVAIIAILAAIAISVFSSSQEKARAAACLANRRSLYAIATTAYMTGEYDTLKDAFLGEYDAGTSQFVCPSGGTFTWADGGDGVEHIVCSVHGASSSGSGSEGSGSESGESGSGGSTPATYGSTNIVLQDNYWPDQSDFEYAYSSVSIPAGGIFQYTDGSYYIVTQNVSVTKSQAASGPGGTVYGWYSTQKLTGNVVTYSGTGEQKSTLSRGDICQVGEDYYVYINGGSWAYGPTVEPGSWYKIPNG